MHAQRPPQPPSRTPRRSRRCPPWPPQRIAAACTFLASKLEEAPCRARNVLNVFHRMERRREGRSLQTLDAASQKYADLKADLYRCERKILAEFGFTAQVEIPHKFAINYMQTLEAPPALFQEAFDLVNDSLRTTLCVRFSASTIACGAIFLAARRQGVALPEAPPWFELFEVKRANIAAARRAARFRRPPAYIHAQPRLKMNNDIQRALDGAAPRLRISALHAVDGCVEKAEDAVIKRHHKIDRRSPVQRIFPITSH